MNEDKISDSCQKIFKFEFPMLTDSTINYELEVPIEIPYPSEPLELCSRIVERFYIPAYVEEDLEKAIVEFVRIETAKFYDKPGTEALEKYQNGEVDVNNLLEKWEKAYSENTVEYGGNQFGSDDAELFSTIYHKLVHSPALETILQVEHSYANTVRDIVKKRDVALQMLQTKQTEEMQAAMEGVGVCLNESEVTAIAARHLEEHGMELARFASKLDSVRDSQKREYREWLMSLMERSCDSPISTPLNSPCEVEKKVSEDWCIYSGRDSKLEESFTIHLGSQLKHMYNIRILSADPLQLVALTTNSSGELESEQSQRLQTALSLYSSDICGLVLLTDSYLGSFSGITKDFISVCELSTELHFDEVEKQLDGVRDSVKEAVEWRKVLAVSPDSNTLTSSEMQARRSSTKYLQTGDVYVTKHSNLSEVHVIFHMVVDDSIKSGDINSRHPAILGLRNIMKCACCNDITSLTIPVLLTHELTDEMSLSWCAKRAELVYKCVKGFMIEMTSWGGAEVKNLQFLVPKGISEELFGSLATMLPSVFKVSNPLVLKGDSPKASSKSNSSKNKSEKKSK